MYASKKGFLFWQFFLENRFTGARPSKINTYATARRGVQSAA
jgi:hypothetical protein